MRYLILFFIYFIYCNYTQAQNTSSELISISELHFYSDAEKEFFTKTAKENANYFQTFACVDPSINMGDANSYYNRVELILKKYEGPKWNKKKNSKKIKSIYSDIHDTFFDQYEEKNLFSEIFKNGKYNCVSATGLYAVVLDKLNIPYEIKEEPTHVFIVAYPKTDQIIVEATNPIAGYTQFSSTFKKDFVDKLVNSKLIGSEESSSLSTEELFNKYFFSKKNIDLKELVGLQYYNDGLYKMADQDFKKALMQLEKSYYLYPNERTGYLMYLNGASFLSKINYDDENYLPILLKLARFEKYGVSNDMIVNEYSGIINYLLFEKGNLLANDSTYKKFYNVINDSTYHNEINYLHFYETARYYYTRGNYEKSLDYGAKAYQTKPNNVQTQTFLIASLGNKLNRIQDIEKINDIVDRYKTNYPKLIENDNFKRIVVNAKLELASFYFYKKMPAEAKVSLSQFEDLDLKNTKPDESSISKVYSSAAIYYYQKGAVSTARNYINKGLSYYPNDFNLNRMLKMMR